MRTRHQPKQASNTNKKGTVTRSNHRIRRSRRCPGRAPRHQSPPPRRGGRSVPPGDLPIRRAWYRGGPHMCSNPRTDVESGGELALRVCSPRRLLFGSLIVGGFYSEVVLQKREAEGTVFFFAIGGGFSSEGHSAGQAPAAPPPGRRGRDFFIFYFLFFIFFLCPMAAEMRQRHAPESHATPKPRSRAPGPKNDPKPSFPKSGVRRAA